MFISAKWNHFVYWVNHIWHITEHFEELDLHTHTLSQHWWHWAGETFIETSIFLITMYEHNLICKSQLNMKLRCLIHHPATCDPPKSHAVWHGCINLFTSSCSMPACSSTTTTLTYLTSQIISLLRPTFRQQHSGPQLTEEMCFLRILQHSPLPDTHTHQKITLGLIKGHQQHGPITFHRRWMW